MLLLGTLPPASLGLVILSCPFVCRYKEEARRACRAGKKQLVSSLSAPHSCVPVPTARGAPVQGVTFSRGTVCGWPRHHSLFYKPGVVLSSGKGSLPLALSPARSDPDHDRVSTPRPPQALRSLKAKQRTEKRIEALHAKLDTVQGILDRIYASQTDQMVATAPLPQCLAGLCGVRGSSPPLWLCCLEEAWVLSGYAWDCLCFSHWPVLASVDMG